MLRIGFIDYFLDEWHANNYPKWIRELGQSMGIEADVCFAWAGIDKPDGMTTKAWCEAYGVTLCPSQAALVEASDALLVLSPDHCEMHEALARLALQSGKPVYIDKTFAPDIAGGQRMFDLACRHGTPLCSSSALRFAPELTPYLGRADISFLATTGPGSLETYLVHQAEMVVALLGDAPGRVLAMGGGQAWQILVDYGGRQAAMLQMPCLDFSLSLCAGDSRLLRPAGFFEGLILSILSFFKSGIPPVSRAQTMAVLALLDAARQAVAAPGQWVPVSGER